MRRTLLLAVALLGYRGALADDVTLEPGPGADTTTAVCSACHTSNYIVMNSPFLTADAWKVEVAKMRSAFGAAIDDATAASIVAYLSEHYGAAPKP